MEEKELDLCELLKDCEGEEFYCPIWGGTVICEIAKAGYRIEPKDKMRGYLNIGFDGKADEDGEVILFPSRALFEKYPLDAKAAWMEWKQKKEKEFNKVTSFISPVSKWWELKVVAKFHSHEEAQQAAEGIREYLKTFHKTT